MTPIEFIKSHKIVFFTLALILVVTFAISSVLFYVLLVIFIVLMSLSFFGHNKGIKQEQRIEELRQQAKRKQLEEELVESRRIEQERLKEQELEREWAEQLRLKEQELERERIRAHKEKEEIRQKKLNLQFETILASGRYIQSILDKSASHIESSFSSEEILKSFAASINSNTKTLPTYLSIGKLAFSLELQRQLNCSALPLLFPITGSNVVYLFDHLDEQVSKMVMQDWGLRLLLTLSSKKAKFKLFDIKGNGRNFPTLVGLHQSIITNDVIDNSQEIRDYLQELRQHEGHLTMNILKGKTSLEEYNRTFPEQAVPYHFLFIANFPAGFTEDTITTLRNIIQHGKESGIYVFMTTTSITEELSSSVQRISEEIQTKYAANVFDWSSYAGIKENTKDFDWEEALRTTGTRVEYDDTLFNRELLIQAINAEASTVKKVISKVTVEQSDLWTKNSSPGLTIPIGRTVSQGIQNFTFGFDSEVYHGLVGGKTGSGKSVLLHNIIVNGARLYSPDELQFILLDYKEGTEFKIYAGLPHTRVLSIDSEREFGLSVLEFLQETINERGKAFKEAGVANITEYRSATNKKLPRFVVVIDEFQVLLSGGDTLATKSSDALADIVKRGRSFGIHILLSTQTLFDTDISVSTLSNIGLRIGLMMQEADAVKLMHFDNIAPSKLQRAGQAIYNTRNGLAEGNEEFQISFTTGEEIKEGVAAIHQYAESVAYHVAHECVVFDGTSEGNISTNSELMKAIQNKSFTVNDASAIAYIGEPALMQSSHCGIKFRKQFGSHTLIVGQDEVAAISIVYHSLYQILHQSSSGSRVVVFDFFNVDSNLRGQFASLKEQFDTVEIISRTSRVQEVIQEFYDETKARMDDETRPGRWVLVILNLHNAHSLQEDYSIQDQFKEILKNGPEGGIHVILYSNTYQPLQEVVGRDGINRCSTKIALSGSDSIQLFDTYNLKPIKKLSTALIQTHGTKYDYDSIKVYSLDKSKLQ